MAESDIADWFRSIPIVTRWWFSLSIIFPLAGRLGLVNPMLLLLDYETVVHGFQVICFEISLRLFFRGLPIF
jgi:derlin-1